MKLSIIKIFSTIINEFVFGGHLLSLGVAGMVFSIILILDIPVDLIVLLIAYLSSQVIYTYNHYREVSDDKSSNPERTKHVEDNKKFTEIFFLFYSGLLFILLNLSNPQTVLFVLTVIIFGILYTEYFKEMINKKVIGFKNFYTSFFWATTAFLVLTFYKLDLSPAFICLFLFLFSRSLVTSALFDIKDIETDGKKKLKTFAVLLGKKKTIILLLIINMLSALPIIFGFYFGYLPKLSFALLFCILYGMYYLIQSYYLTGKALRIFSYHGMF